MTRAEECATCGCGGEERDYVVRLDIYGCEVIGKESCRWIEGR